MSGQTIDTRESMKCPKCGGYLWPGVPGYGHSCPDAPTEMASLTQIKAKLDETLKILKGNEHWPGLDIRTDKLFTLQATKFQDVLAKLDAIADSQGKLLEAISGLRESGMRNHQQIRRELAAVRLCRKSKKGPRR